MRSKSIDTASLVLAAALILYVFANVVYLIEIPIALQNTFLFFCLLLVFLPSLKRSKKLWPLFLILILLSVAATAYVKIFFSELQMHPGTPSIFSVIIGIILLLLVIIATQQAFGLIFPLIAVIFILYGAFGHYLPEPLYHSPISPPRFIAHMAIGLRGVYGVSLGVAVKYIFLFVIFGAFLRVSGAVEFFIELGRAVSKLTGAGMALGAVAASALVGTITGATTANVLITGSFTIPLMKRMGLRPEVAGAVESAASSGGQIMPPVMGAAGFLMAGYLGIPYTEVMLAAVLPALIYFLIVGVAVILEVRKTKLLVPSEPIDIKLILTRGPVAILPIILIAILLVNAYTPMYAAFWAIVLFVVLSSLRRETRLSLPRLKEGTISGATAGAQLGVACACLGAIMAVITLTGLGERMATVVEALSGGHLPIALLLVMSLAFVLGTALPTLAAYAIIATVVTPVLSLWGLSVFQIHFFSFLCAAFATITPPIGMASIVASRVAESKYWPTAIIAFKFAFVGFLTPFLLVWNPAIIGQFAGDPSWAVLSIIAVAIGCIALMAVLQNYFVTELSFLQRALFSFSGVGLIAFAFFKNYWLFALIGAVLFFLVSLWQFRFQKEPL